MGVGNLPSQILVPLSFEETLDRPLQLASGREIDVLTQVAGIDPAFLEGVRGTVHDVLRGVDWDGDLTDLDRDGDHSI